MELQDILFNFIVTLSSSSSVISAWLLGLAMVLAVEDWLQRRWYGFSVGIWYGMLVIILAITVPQSGNCICLSNNQTTRERTKQNSFCQRILRRLENFNQIFHIRRNDADIYQDSNLKRRSLKRRNPNTSIN